MTDPAFPPPFATDCHTHLVGDPARYPMVSPRAYTPAPITASDMRAMMDRVGLGRIVIVQISVHGNDNACMLNGMAELGACARGVVQVDDTVSNAKLDEMHAVGVRGIRANLNTSGITDPDEVRRRLNSAARHCARNGWHLQIYTSPPVLSVVGDLLLDLPVPVVIDHFGLLSVASRGGDAEKVVREILSSGRGWVKISGTYRLDRPEASEDIASLARDLYRENPDNIVWGTDWPHPPHHQSAPEENPPPRPYRNINPADMLATIRDWFEDPRDRARILVANPARLYDFPVA
jgi:predicted TIM-barrel fold metal-dependent hydrolase